MQYKVMKDYKKILEGVVNIINTAEKSDIGFANICTYIGENCPELKENDDERIRGNIIATIHLYYGEPLEDEAKEMIAWLEKKGEQKIKTPEESLGIYSDTYNKIVDECIYGEQNPACSDEAMWVEISDLLWEGYKQSGSKFSWDDIRNWVIHKLKSIRLQKQWKPSDEQMNTLEYYMHTLICNVHKEVLFGLYADLKKLMDE